MSQLRRRQVLDMRNAYDLGSTIREIARRFKRSESCVSGVVRRLTYVRVKEGEIRWPYDDGNPEPRWTVQAPAPAKPSRRRR